jgi:tetratricopeptide (TPR) repeat protein
MELTLTTQSATQVAVHCDGQFSHSFDLLSLAPDPAVPGGPPLIPAYAGIDDPVAYGQAVYQALFPPGSLAAQALARGPTRLLLVADAASDAVPWEYAHGPDGFLILDVALVRGLPAAQRVPPPALAAGLHIIAVPSNPLAAAIPPLDIDGEWQRLKEVVQQTPTALTLERTRPATPEHLRRLLAGQRQRVVHFMGHGGNSESGALLFFEQIDGGPTPVTAQDFLRRIKGTTFLVTLNACVSATPGPTDFANLAAALVHQGAPYALGMRFSVTDDDAHTFSRVFYSELARGSAIEEALQQARLELAASPHPWALGVPVLYTALAEPATGFAPIDGQPVIREHQAPLDVFALPRAEGAFQGRQAELRRLGARLTGDSRPRLLTIYGTGGQGKTALAREAVERFAHAFPGGAVALALESLPGRAQIVGDLARFLGIATEEIAEPVEIERLVLTRLGQQRSLLVLDNAETLVQAARAGEPAAQQVAQLLKEQLPPSVLLLATSREYLGWAGEEALPLGGLDHRAGAHLFQQYAANRIDAIALAEAQPLSEKVDGHPLSLRLLGSAFNDLSTPLADFVRDHAAHLFQSEDRYRDAEHRQRSLYQSIDFSVRFLDDELRGLLGGLWIFHAPFLPELAEAIFDPDGQYPDGQHSPIHDLLHRLAQRSLLERESVTTSEGVTRFYRLHPTVRLFAEQQMERPLPREEFLRHFGSAYANLSRSLYRGIDRSAALVVVAQRCAGDLDRGLEYASAEQQGWYLLHRGWVVQRLGDRRRGLELIEQALAAAGADNQKLKLQALNNMALVYDATGQPQRALELYEQALPIFREVGDRAGEATTLANLAGLLYQQLDRAGEAIQRLQAAITLLIQTGLDRDAAGQTLELLQQVLSVMQRGESLGGGQPGPATLPAE